MASRSGPPASFLESFKRARYCGPGVGSSISAAAAEAAYDDAPQPILQVPYNYDDDDFFRWEKEPP